MLFLLLVGIAIAALNTRPENPVLVQERSADQYSNMFFSYTVIKYPASVEVITATLENISIGFNTETDELAFSKIVLGGSVRKYLNLTTRDGKISKITLSSRGPIAPMLKFGKNEFILNGNDVISVVMDANKLGNYTGEVSVVIQRSNYELQRRILGY